MLYGMILIALCMYCRVCAGWILQWNTMSTAPPDTNGTVPLATTNTSTTTTTTTTTFRNLGAVNFMEAPPSTFIPLRPLLLPSSSSDNYSAINSTSPNASSTLSSYVLASIWAGSVGDVEIISTSSMRSDGFILQTSVKIRNNGENVLNDVLCKYI